MSTQRELAEPHAFTRDTMSEGAPARFDELIVPTAAELAEAVDRFNLEAKRSCFWRWWFVGMFTLWTTLAGILLLRLFGIV
jgi:hypothetical protein